MAVAKTARSGSKHQQRTEATQAKLIAAAEEVFIRDGFANARLENIAVAAGYTRGAIYAHYKSKEDLFLALLEQRIQSSIREFNAAVEQYPTREERVRRLRAMLVRKAADRNWAMLVLEFKLFALRQPKIKLRLQRLIALLHKTSRQDSLEQVFGELKPREARRIHRRMALVGAVLSAVVLESNFRPELLSGRDFDEALDEVLQSLVHP